MKFIFFLSIPLCLLDQWTKYLVVKSIEPNDARVVVAGFFDLVNVTNTGAAFGSFKNNNTFFVILSCVALMIIVTLLVRHKEPDAWRDLSLALLLAGVLGNLSDRLLHGYVIDFLLFDLHVPLAHPYPAFNVADSCICIAVFFFVLHSLFQRKTSPETAPAE